MREVNPPAIIKEATEAESLFAEAQSGLGEFERLGRATADQAIQVGLVLIRAKECCPHGKWMELMQRYFPGGKDRTARRAMLAAKRNKESVQRPSETLTTMVVGEKEEDEEDVSKLDNVSNLDTPEEPPCAEESAVEQEQESSPEPTSEPDQQSIPEPAVSQEEEQSAESEETPEPEQVTPEPTAAPPLPEPSIVSAEPIQEEPTIAPTQPDGPEWYVRYEMRDGTVCTRNIIPRRLRHLECEYVIDAYDVEKEKEIVLSLIRVVSWHAEKPPADSPKPSNNGTPKKTRRGDFKA